MEIIGALKKSSCQSTIYFCRYNPQEFSRKQVSEMLIETGYNENLSEKEVVCIAVERNDKISSKEKSVGLILSDKNGYINIVLQGYEDLVVYFNELTELTS